MNENRSNCLSQLTSHPIYHRQIRSQCKHNQQSVQIVQIVQTPHSARLLAGCLSGCQAAQAKNKPSPTSVPRRIRSDQSVCPATPHASPFSPPTTITTFPTSTVYIGLHCLEPLKRLELRDEKDENREKMREKTREKKEKTGKNSKIMEKKLNKWRH